MARALRRVLTIRWVVVHLVTVALSVAMVELGLWQLHVSDAKHFSLQNFFYAVQWWVFVGFVLFFWARVVRDAVRPPAAPQSGRGGEVVVADGAGGRPIVPGPALLVGDRTGDAPAAVYRGYVMPQSGSDPDRSGNDVMRDAYNDHLWQLALADSAAGDAPRPTTPRGAVEISAIRRELDARQRPDAELGDATRPALPAAE